MLISYAVIDVCLSSNGLSSVLFTGTLKEHKLFYGISF